MDLIAGDGRGLAWSLVGSVSATDCYWVLNVSKVWTAEDRQFMRGVGAHWELVGGQATAPGQ